jgi:hypothetical protein
MLKKTLLCKEPIVPRQLSTLALVWVSRNASEHAIVLKYKAIVRGHYFASIIVHQNTHHTAKME